MVYSSVDEENARAILEAFTKSTGIQVQFVHLSSGPALARLEAEKDNPMADIWMGAPSENHVLAKERGLTQPYKSPNAAALDPKFVDPEGYWTSFYMNPMGVAMNTAWAARAGVEAPESWYDLLKPEFGQGDPDAHSPVFRYCVQPGGKPDPGLGRGRRPLLTSRN